MNKQVIKTYFKEFTHWLDGGELLTRNIKYIDGISSKWHVSTTPYWNDENYQFIINDEYVEFRKALAEGKTVQIFWVDHWYTNEEPLEFTEPVTHYRIEPDEPEFKVGDYVQYFANDNSTCDKCIGIIRYIDKTGVEFESGNAFGFSEGYLRPWTLEEVDDDEWVCVLWECGHVNIRQKKDTSGYRTHEQVTFVPYIGQTLEQLGLEK